MSFNIFEHLTTKLEEVSNEPNIGEVAVLSIGRGDMKINFNSDNPEEVEKARMVIMDMLKRGYLIFINVDGKDCRITDFDPKTDEYIIKLDKRSKVFREMAERIEPDSEEQPKIIKPRTKKREKRINAKKTHGTAIAPTSGG